jgi:hypothetical protein
MYFSGFYVEFQGWTLYLDVALAVCKNLTAC